MPNRIRFGKEKTAVQEYFQRILARYDGPHLATVEDTKEFIVAVLDDALDQFIGGKEGGDPLVRAGLVITAGITSLHQRFRVAEDSSASAAAVMYRAANQYLMSAYKVLQEAHNNLTAYGKLGEFQKESELSEVFTAQEQ